MFSRRWERGSRGSRYLDAADAASAEGHDWGGAVDALEARVEHRPALRELLRVERLRPCGWHAWAARDGRRVASSERRAARGGRRAASDKPGARAGGSRAGERPKGERAGGKRAGQA